MHINDTMSKPGVISCEERQQQSARTLLALIEE
jgi:hypothetical protein